MSFSTAILIIAILAAIMSAGVAYLVRQLLYKRTDRYTCDEWTKKVFCGCFIAITTVSTVAIVVGTVFAELKHFVGA